MSDPREPDATTAESPLRQTLSPEDFEHRAVIGRTPTTVVHNVSLVGEPSQIAVKHPARHGTVQGDVFETFQNEAERWAQLAAHDHIVGVIDWDESPLPWVHHDADLPWIAMEYMDGGDLSEYAGGLTVDAARWTAERLADAVWYAHHDGGGVIHHDLKPENVLFRSTPDEQYDVPKIADWELARTLLDHTNSVGVTTPLYVAPEQAHNDPTDQRTDQFQLGIVLYELFTGVHPFVADPTTAPEAAVINSILDNDPNPPTEIDPTLPPSLDDVLGTMLAKDPADRYEALLQVRNALRAIDDEPSDSSAGSHDSPTVGPTDDETSSTVSSDGSEPSVDANQPINVSTGIVLDYTETRGRAQIKSDLATDGVFYLSGVDRTLEVGQEVALFYEGTEPSASDILDVQPHDDIDPLSSTGEPTEVVGSGVVIETTGDSRANVRTDLANDGVYYLSDLDEQFEVGDEVFLYATEPDPTATEIERVLPADDSD